MTITLKTSLGTEFGLFSNYKFLISLWYGTELDLFILKQTNISIKLWSFQPGIQIYFFEIGMITIQLFRFIMTIPTSKNIPW